MKNKTILILIPILSLLFLSACNIKNNSLPAKDKSPEIVKCADQDCFLPKFINCQPSEFQKPLADDANYTMTVRGWEANDCVYDIKLVNIKGETPEGVTNCRVPKEKVSENIIKYWLGEYKDSTTKSMRIEQAQIWNDYCVHSIN